MTTTAETLRESFGTIGKKYGFDKVGAEFVPYRDFKVKWTRSYKWADFQVSDYLMDAPGVVLDGLAETLFSRISGTEVKPYTPEMNEWITSPEFRNEKQPIYVRRSRNISRSPVGKNKDLTESLNRLKRMGLVDKGMDPYLTWTRAELQTTCGYCSTLMDAIVISSAFDLKTLPDMVLDFVLYHECLIIRNGWANFGFGDEFDIFEEKKKFPDWEEAEGWIERMGLHL